METLSCAIVLFSSIIALGQKKVDSLNTLLTQTHDPDKKIEVLISISDQFQNPHEKLPISRKAYKISSGASSKGKIAAANEMGISHGMLGQLDSSTFYFAQALEVSLQSNDSMHISRSYNGLGNVERMQGNLEIALANFLGALEYANASPSEQWPADILTNIGGVYFDLKNWQAALENVLEARNRYANLNDGGNMSYTANLLAIVYRKLGNLEKSYAYNQEALVYLIDHKDTAQIIYNYLNSAAILLDQEKWELAAEKGKHTIELARSFGDLDPQISSHLALSRIYLRTGKLSLSLQHNDTGLQLIRNHNLRTHLSTAYYSRALIEASLKNYEKAHSFMTLAESVNDSIRSSEISDRLSELSVRYETEKKETEIQRLNAEGEIRNLELEKAKNRNLFLLILSLLFVLAGGIIFFLYRQRIKINRQLEAANETKDHLFSIVAHDIKNPLSAIKSFVGVMGDSYDAMSPTEVKHFLGLLDTSANNLLILLQNLLEWSITETGNLSHHPENISLSKMSDDAISLFKGMIDSKNLKVENNISNQLEGYADYKMIFSVIRNLLSNSVKFTPKQGMISLEASENDDLIWVALKDTGSGMPPEQVETLFKNNVHGSKEGTGLGLILCKQFVEKNGGSVEVESRQGEGTTFRFSVKKAT